MKNIKLMRNGEVICLYMGDEIPVNEALLPSMLCEEVELEDGATLRSFFRMLKRYELLAKLDGWVPHLLDLVDKLPEVGCSKPNLSHLEVGQFITIMSKSKTPKMRLGEQDSNGFSKAFFDYIDKPLRQLDERYSLSGRKNDSDENYSISMTPLSEILDLKLTLGKARVFLSEDDRKLDETFGLSINLISFINCIVSEITFHGTEGQKEDTLKELQELTKDLEEKIKQRDKRKSFSVVEGGLKDR